MKGFILLILAIFLFTGCETSGGWELNNKTEIGVQMQDEAGNSGFCVYEMKATPETFEQNLTCGMDLIIGNKIIRCEKLRVGHVYKNFETEINCRTIMDRKKIE